MRFGESWVQGAGNGGMAQGVQRPEPAEAEGPPSRRRWSSEQCPPFRSPSALDPPTAQTGTSRPRSPDSHERLHPPHIFLAIPTLLPHMIIVMRLNARICG